MQPKSIVMKSPNSSFRSPGDAVRQARVRAGDDDRVERGALRAVLVEAVEQLGLELLLRHTRLNDLAEFGERLVGDGLRLAHQLDLPRLLRRAEGVDLRLHRTSTACSASL